MPIRLLLLLASVLVLASLWGLEVFESARHDDSQEPERGFLFDLEKLSEEEKKEEGHAWEFFNWWYAQRAYPNELIPKSAFWEAYEYAKAELAPAENQRSASTWTSIGPDNIGGRMLAVVVDPANSSTLWAGAASGGLWKSTTAGEGAQAWDRVETNFPSLSVSSIVFDANNSDVMYLGTGEISRYARPLVGTPGARSSYGLGVIKSTDHGVTWEATGLTWTFDQSRAVLALRADPVNSSVVWAATSEGVYKTTDAGANWTLSHNLLMAMDLVVDPTDVNTVYAAHGQLGVPAAPDAGIYKTTNGGTTWTKLGGGLPTTDFGRTPLSISTDGNTIYAGVGNASTRGVHGLYRSTNGGSSWQLRSSTQYAASQSWYDNTVAVSPINASLVIVAGLDCYRSTSGGSSLSQVSQWFLGFDGVVPAGGEEGPSDYVHADQHAITFDESNPSTVYVACDGGIFKSTDSGVSWSGKNGGLRTTQFYAGFAASDVTNGLALGGLQDNGTVKYLGTDSWSKVFGGDGGWCAIDPSNENVLYEEYIYLNMHKSTNGGNSWFQVHAGVGSGNANFIAPFVISKSNPNTLYAGTLSVEKTTNGGSSWFFPDGDSNWNGTPVATIGISATSPDTLIAGTGNSSASPTIEVRRSVNGGSSWQLASGLPDRYPTDFSYDPMDTRTVWATVSGYGTGHVFRSTDAGLTWEDRSGDLADIPAQSVLVDPTDSSLIYVGTDLGTFRSTDAGTTWTSFNNGMPLTMVLDLVLKNDERLLRAATFGNGVWEIPLPAIGTDAPELQDVATSFSLENHPNPFRNATSVSFTLPGRASTRVTIHDVNGRLVRTLENGELASGSHEVSWDGRDESGSRSGAGVYFARIDSDGRTQTRKMTLLR